MKSLDQLPTIANVAAGNTVTINLPVGNVYEKIFLYYEGVTAGQLRDIEIKLNDRIVSEYPDGNRLLSMDKHYNRATEDGCIVFNFTRDELHNLSQRRFFGLDTSPTQGISVAAINIDIDAGAVNPKLKAFAEKSMAVAGAPNYLTKVRRFFKNVDAAGTFDIDNIPKPAGASIAAIHLYMHDDNSDGVCDLSKAMLLVNNVNWHDLDAKTAASIQSFYGRTPETHESTVIDMVMDGDIQQSLPLDATINDMRLRCTAESAGQIEVMVEYVDTWGVGRF
ncbi:major capsid protein P2 [Alteromonas lipotrueae]|uniref:major capsid protein P2 n=1 Tax=Alteromonas lipotrueae TaxID=2803814 RepID=UPI001C4753C4|nr:major capsid protein P2 [Alteromonas lipotrueae]